jgi:hypothetical protein
VKQRKPTWSTASVLVYMGGLTVLGAAIGALAYLAGSKAGTAGWALLILAVLSAVAEGFRLGERWTAAGIFAFAAVIAWAVFVGALWSWFGWLGGAAGDSGFSLARLSIEALVIGAALVGLRRFRFPLISAIGVGVGAGFVIDLLSDGGTWSIVVMLFVGLVYLAIGSGSDRPSAFWFHLASGLLIGGSLLYWWHGGDWQWGLICLASLAYVAVARRTGRSSWAVLGGVGLLAATTHFAGSWGTDGGARSTVSDGGSLAANPYVDVSPLTSHGWVPPLVFACTGFLLVGLGIGFRRRPTG